LNTSVPSRHNSSEVLAHIGELYEELIQRDGFGELTVMVRILKRGQKEVLVRCAKESRYVVDCAI
jgi:hypothetical protein